MPKTTTNKTEITAYAVSNSKKAKSLAASALSKSVKVIPGQKKMSKPVKAMPDDLENPVWTREDFAKAVPASEVLPGIFGAEMAAEMLKPKGGRPMATSHKVPVTIRLNPEVATYFKATGKGWQTKMNEALQEYVNQHK